MKRLRRFTARDLITEAGASYANVNHLIWELRRKGFLRSESTTRNWQCKSYTVYLLRREPSPTVRPVAARHRVWAAIRILRQFTIPDLTMTADASRASVEFYVCGLVRDGYLRIARPRVSGVRAGSAIYALANDAGPVAPRLLRRRAIIESEGAAVA